MSPAEEMLKASCASRRDLVEPRCYQDPFGFKASFIVVTASLQKLSIGGVLQGRAPGLRRSLDPMTRFGSEKPSE
jgi:hypothetical protein